MEYPYSSLEGSYVENEGPSSFRASFLVSGRPIINRIWKNSAGDMHREDGPAFIRVGATFIDDSKGGPVTITGYGVIEEGWWINGVRSRFDGPAHCLLNIKEFWWYINGIIVDEDEYKAWLVNNGMDIDNLTEDDRMFILLTWG